MRILLSLLLLSLTASAQVWNTPAWREASTAVPVASGGSGTWAQDKASATGSTSGTAVNTSFSPTAGSFVLVGISYRNDSAQAITSVTDNGSGGSSTYSAAFNVANVNGHYTLAVFYCYNVKASVTTITVNVPTSGRVNTVIKSYTGQQTTSDPLDQVSTQGSNVGSSTQTSPNITTTAGRELIVGYAFQTTDATHTFSATAPNTLISNITDGLDGVTTGLEENLNQPVGTYNAAFTTTGSVQWWSYAASFKGQ